MWGRPEPRAFTSGARDLGLHLRGRVPGAAEIPSLRLESGSGGDDASGIELQHWLGRGLSYWSESTIQYVPVG